MKENCPVFQNFLDTMLHLKKKRVTKMKVQKCQIHDDSALSRLWLPQRPQQYRRRPRQKPPHTGDSRWACGTRIRGRSPARSTLALRGDCLGAAGRTELEIRSATAATALSAWTGMLGELIAVTVRGFRRTTPRGVVTFIFF